MKFGLMFFASSEDALGRDKYRLVLESARFADLHGFSTVWAPERHFTKFGSLYPNPAVLHAAIATTTQRIRLNAGSVVGPLHNPIRIAEEWAMVDNLSHGRVGISFASGWNPDDFAFFPGRYANRHEEMYAGIRTVQKLWRGESLDAVSGNQSQIQVRLYPTPVQRELPTWVTAAGNPQSFVRAGQIGANLLTHVLDQDEDQLSRKIALYRQARADNGWDPASGTVSVMLHTFVGQDAAVVRDQARSPFCQYIKSNIGLLNGLAHSRGQKVDVRALSASDLDDFTHFLYDRFATSRGLIGTPESCRPAVDALDEMGVDEIACLLDFGPDADLILQNLPHLARLKDLYDVAPKARPASARVETARFCPEVVKARLPEELSGVEFNRRLRDHEIEIDGCFAAIERIWRRDGEALALIHFPQEPAADAYSVHPGFLDACSRVLAAALPAHQAGFYLPVGVDSVAVHASAPVQVWSSACISSGAGKIIKGDIAVYANDGSLVLEIEGLRLQQVSQEESPARNRAQAFANLLYRQIWKVAPPEGEGHSAETWSEGERWLILADRSGIGGILASSLEAGGATCTLISSDGDFRDLLWSRPHGVVYLWSLDATSSESLTVDAVTRDQEMIAGGALQLVQALSKQSPGPLPRTWFVTRGAMAVLDGEAPAIAQSPLWGLARAMSVEHPEAWGGLVDLDPNASPEAAAAELQMLLRRRESEDTAAFRNGRRHVPRLVREDRYADRKLPLRFFENATYLITGGLGGIALELAVWMAQRGAQSLALMARHAPHAKASDALQRLERMGVRVSCFQADVTRQAEVAAAIDEMRSAMPPLKGVFHLAGSLEDALLMGQDLKRFRAAGSAKMEGAWNLHHLTRSDALDHFVLFSSMASLCAMSGQGNYAAANSFLDALAAYRRSQGMAALGIHWGPWSRVGHAATEYGKHAHRHLAQAGIESIEPELALDVLEFLMEQNRSDVGVVRSDWSKLFGVAPTTAVSPMFFDLAATSRKNVSATQEHSEIVIELRGLPAAEREAYLQSFLSGLIRSILKIKGLKTIEPRQGLFELGLDSLMALELKARLETSLGRSFRPTLLFTSPTLEALANHLLTDIFGVSAKARDAAATNLDSLSEESIADLIAGEIARAV